MKGLLLAFLCVLVTSNAFGSLPHWDPEMTGEEYARILAVTKRRAAVTESERALEDILKVGKRSLDWLTFINSNRPPEQKISYSSAATQMAYPITTPGLSNPTIVQTQYDTFWAEAPAWFANVVLKGDAFTPNPPTTDEEFMHWGLRFDRIYQKASRWILQEPFLWSYSARRKNDVRGFYYLGQYTDLEATLNNYASLSAEEQANITEWMAGMCYNTASTISGCKSDWNALVKAGKPLMPFYSKYVAGGKKMWDSYFLITSKRSDVEWGDADPNTMHMPFARPESSEVERFLIDNLHDEWKLNEWKLRLNFTTGSFGTAHIVFEAGATPHVNGLAGNTITMDKNQPLTEYNVQWTIRHEFGHVIGLPDCYVEFYDQDQKVMINYQLDITNLMCSRRGHLKDIHYTELKKAYYK